MTSTTPKPTHIDLSQVKNSQHLEKLARSEPGTIDTILLPYLLDPKLPNTLRDLIYHEVTQCVTPEVFWGGNPTRTYWPSCCIHASLLGRAYTLLNHDPIVIIEQSIIRRPRALEEQKADIWKVMSDIFIKALFSGAHPEPGARVAVAVLMLTCGKTMSQIPGLKGKGADWLWYDDKICSPDTEWGWEELKRAVMETENLPRDQTNAGRAQDTSRTPVEYIPQIVLDALDAARTHIAEGKEDLNSQGFEKEVYGKLFK